MYDTITISKYETIIPYSRAWGLEVGVSGLGFTILQEGVKDRHPCGCRSGSAGFCGGLHHLSSSLIMVERNYEKCPRNPATLLLWNQGLQTKPKEGSEHLHPKSWWNRILEAFPSTLYNASACTKVCRQNVYA